MTAGSPPRRLGFIGLGNMGGPMSANLAPWCRQSGSGLTVYDKAGTNGRVPDGANAAGSAGAVAEASETVFLSLPDGTIVLSVIDELAEADGFVVKTVVDFSTIGLESARASFERCAKAGMAYIDAPVSGGRAGAAAGTISVMWAGPADLLGQHRSALDAMAGNVFHVGTEAGQGQALKLLNNFLSATAMAATSEAVLFGLASGLEMDTMLAVLNVSTGQNTAVSDKFPRRIATGTFDSGFDTALMAKDMALYRACIEAAGSPRTVGLQIDDLWQGVDKALPGSDFTQIYEFIRDRREV